MKKDNGLSIVALIIIIAFLLGIAFLAYFKLFGENGIVNKYDQTETEYNKEEIVVKLNAIVREKYILDTKYCTENNQNIDEIYNLDALLQYLQSKEYIEELKDINDNLVENQYYINPNALNSDLAVSEINENGSNSNGTKIFKIKRINDELKIFFVDKYGEEEELGDLVIKPEI